MIDVRRLDKYVSIQRRSTVKDGYGQESTEWVEVKSVWAEIRPITGREKMRAGAIEMTVTHTVAIRFDADLEPLIEMDNCRITCRGRAFRVKSAIDLNEERKWIILDCEEGAVNGG